MEERRCGDGTGSDLQRLFRFEVGLSPKETIRRFRLQQAADRFHEDPDTRGSALTEPLRRC